MFNLLVKYSGWANGRDTIALSRLFEYTDDGIQDDYQSNGKVDFDNLMTLPAVFAQETQPSSDQIVQVGTIYRARIVGTDIQLEYVFDPTVPVITNAMLETLSNELEIREWEMHRTHWAVKDADLFRALLQHAQPRRNRPRVFNINDPERIETTLVSAMMPFQSSFDEVYTTLKEAATDAGLHCRRADDIWENPAVIQDVVSLIDRSRVVICDCTDRNPNVFYEVGIAHTLGREVILITQNERDIPFDLRHLRYVSYLNNGEGRRSLREKLVPRLVDLAGA
jgi:hypothetical protein